MSGALRQSDLFAAGAERLLYDDAVELTLMSLAEHGPKHDHWAIAWSGGKDSTATLTLIVHLIEAGRLAPPKTLTVYYADTRQELTPLAIAAADTDLPPRGGPRVKLVHGGPFCHE